MGKYCCFCCPAEDLSEKSLDDECPNCGLQYGFPLYNQPLKIEGHRVIRSLDRGFYAATYITERGNLDIRSVLKVSPKALYDFFPNKDFEKECRVHKSVSEGTEHIVGIRDMFESEVEYGDIVLPCYVAELEHVEGESLAKYLESKKDLTPTQAAQISVDLLKIRDELIKKNVYHNDLHDKNVIIEFLEQHERRIGVIDGTIRAVAIDLGSVSDGSRSDSDRARLGDLQWISMHLNRIVEELTRDPDIISDHENRLAGELHRIAQSISPSAVNQRTPDTTDFVRQIEESYYNVIQPWRKPLELRTFGDSYNAQTMNAWHVPQLLVDPDGQWVSSICSPGPQVITGMRGCGKTMLLRALQFHARATHSNTNSKSEVQQQLKKDNYVGLFVSAQRLLDSLGDDSCGNQDPFARLFVAYGLESVRAANHLSDIDEECILGQAYRNLADTIGGHLQNSEEILAATSMYDLESRLTRFLTSICQGNGEFSLTGHPNNAFPFLAEAIRKCSPIWNTAQVLFLLDDVSTRYLNQPRINDLLSALLFQSPSCAFKMTSEAQTIELGLKSPGESHPLRVGRDLSVFDLGAKVYEKIKKPGKGNGRYFVEEILKQRAEYFSAHPPAVPRELLGDVPLEAIAAEIGESPKDSRKRKEIYRGISALAHMCVGDIGDVISLYEQILISGTGQEYPISSEIQSECFQDFCARRLYDLNRRRGYLKDIAKSFAEASNYLLVQSCSKPVLQNGKRRIRQYSSLYVRITTGDYEKQTDQLRELIDAGVFVFAGGSNVPRTKTRDSNPTQQFKLTFRKIYGLVSFIGLADRDRYELSGKDLEEWLNEPRKGKDVLLRNLVTVDSEDELYEEEATKVSIDPKLSPESQFTLFEMEKEVIPPLITTTQSYDLENKEFLKGRNPIIKKLNGTFTDLTISCGIFGLGFEERTLESARRLFSLVKPHNAIVIEYPEPGRSVDILSIVKQSTYDYTTIPYSEAIEDGLPDVDGNVLIDITGLAKPVIFHAVRNELRRKRRVWICYTEAESHYPLDTDLEGVFRDDQPDTYTQLERLSKVLSGEIGPYKSVRLLPYDSDDTRQRVLCAFSSPKHERLLTLLDFREYDRMEIVAPKNKSNRSKVAKIAAEIVARNSLNSKVTEIDSNDIENVLTFITSMYKLWYLDNGLNFEVSLTGSKLQAVACAAASAAYKISQCWYLHPKTFDPDRFTQGVKDTHYFELSLE